MIATGYLLGFGYGVLCLLAAFLLSRLGVKKAITRKFVHIFIGFEWVILYAFHGATYHFLIVCLCFLALLIVAYKKRLLQMISSDGDNAPGTVYYAVSMSLMALASLIDQRFILPFGLAVFVTSLGDGFAGLLGGLVKKHNPKIYKQKTLVGALANFVLSTATALAFMMIFEDMGLTPTHCLVIGALSVGIELISGVGLDNITLPILVATFTYISTAFYAETVKYFLPIALTPLIISFVVERKNLTRGGTIAAIFLDIAVSISLGNLGFLLLLAFLVLGILTDKLKRKNTECKEEKSSHRDASQVLANGLVPIVCAAIYFAIGERAFLLAYVAALAEALGDTAASSLGGYSKSTFDLFKFRKCEQGISGGVSLIGTLSAVIFSAIIPLIAFAFGLIPPSELIIAIAIAILGVFFDSLLGSILQATFHCSVCGALTEK
ncbi:MAG: DUF92 domain-containing protein, partial [Clostridia bacterium]|nr:DUF92 domain-containing protein [Clostridia bacterium]